VVIVIIAILAAIGVPALTGYIDKAQDKKYIAAARDHAVAARAVMDDAYAKGEFSNDSSGQHSGDYINQPMPDDFLMQYWSIYDLSDYATGDDWVFYSEITSLLGEKEAAIGDEGWWYFDFAGPKGEANALNASGFWWYIYPEGWVADAPVIAVTYKLERLNLTDGDSFSSFLPGQVLGATYNDNAGYEVYHLIADV
jgi:type II secretory pathway pseudopilin PulG